MRVLVTGSSGFIGQHLVRSLAEQGFQVAGLDIRPGVSVCSDVHLCQCDILDSEGLKRAVDRLSPDAIIHLAARTDLEERHDINGYAANVRGVENIIFAIRATSSIKRAIFTSSQLVCRVGYVPKDDQDYAPNTVYGESKMLTEKIVRRENGGDIPWCLVRPTTVWGPGMGTHFQRFFRLIYKGIYFHIGHEPVYQPYGYVGNVVTQYARLLTANPKHFQGKTLYLSEYQPLSLQEWTNALQQAMNAPRIRTLPESLARVLANLGDVMIRMGMSDFPLTSFRLKNLTTSYEFDLRETQKACGPLPYTMEQGVQETVRWLKDARIIPAQAA